MKTLLHTALVVPAILLLAGSQLALGSIVKPHPVAGKRTLVTHFGKALKKPPKPTKPPAKTPPLPPLRKAPKKPPEANEPPGQAPPPEAGARGLGPPPRKDGDVRRPGRPRLGDDHDDARGDGQPPRRGRRPSPPGLHRPH